MTHSTAQGRRLAYQWPNLHPILIVLYPVSIVYGRNLNFFFFRDFMVYSGKAIAALALIWALMALVFSEAEKATLFTGVLLLLFLNYGSLIDQSLRRVEMLNWFAASPHLHLYVTVLLIVVFGRWLYLRRGSVRVPNMVLSALYLTLVLSVIAFDVLPGYSDAQPVLDEASSWEPDYAASGVEPQSDSNFDRDIYYLIFDRYAGEQTLKDRFDYNNREFLDGLRDRGFAVADNAYSNYPFTSTSLASSMNMVYHTDLEESLGSIQTDARHAHYARIRHNVVGRFLQESGYQFVNIGSGSIVNPSIPQADKEHPHTHRVTLLGVDLRASHFTASLLGDTVFGAIDSGRIEWWGWTILGSSLDPLDYHAATIDSQLAALDEASGEKGGPKYVVAHVLLPHPPFVYDRDGSRVPPIRAAERPRDTNFLNQTIHTNQVILDLIDKIYANSAPGRPLIVLQSDEGPYFDRLVDKTSGFTWETITNDELEQKVGILMAVNDPDFDLGGTPTPVNTFRKIFNTHFGQNLEILPDRVYVFDGNRYRYRDVTDQLTDG